MSEEKRPPRLPPRWYIPFAWQAGVVRTPDPDDSDLLARLLPAGPCRIAASPSHLITHAALGRGRVRLAAAPYEAGRRE